jgi:hypothetical protein
VQLIEGELLDLLRAAWREEACYLSTMIVEHDRWDGLVDCLEEGFVPFFDKLFHCSWGERWR